MNDSDIKTALKELEKKVGKHTNTAHVKQLLRITMSMRRQWIEKESTSINEVIAKYPPLEHFEMVRILYVYILELLFVFFCFTNISTCFPDAV